MVKFNENAVIIFSGGQDSTTCLLWAIKTFKQVSAVTFNYNQRHSLEIESAKTIITKLNSRDDITIDWMEQKPSISHDIIDVSFLSDALESAMIQASEIGEDEETGLPTTFVPGRNILFLTIAAAIAYQRKIKHLVAGVCQTDFSGYPDCRDVTIKSLQATLSLGLDRDVVIHTPLMWKSKADTVRMMQDMEGIELLKYTHTCYEGMRPACGKCPACKLRLKGFKEAGIQDPLEYEAR